MNTGELHIGTSGWSYKHWVGEFYPETAKGTEQLDFYVNFFDSVELNSSFYHMPKKTAFRSWAENTPDEFVFSVKASRYITHLKKLEDTENSVNFFIHRAQELGRKLGPILFQLPPHWEINRDRFSRFIKQLPGGYRYAFEFRNPTWYHPSVYELLQRYNCAFCQYHLSGHLSPLKVTADFVYVRLHGPGGKYQGSYDTNTLRKWSERCNRWQAEGKDVFVYFDNDQLAYAVYNALQLKEMINERVAADL
jgi:uncharacterized protein YecE (DUF72 family)